MSTGNFAEENELGEGGFGKVYKVNKDTFSMCFLGCRCHVLSHVLQIT
jgi:hypothetical protein